MAHALAPPGPVASGRVDPEPERGAVRLLFRQARDGCPDGSAFDRVLLKEDPMSAKVHIHIHVSDLAKSREFYQKFFDVLPVKERVGYVKFLPAFAPINLALSQGLPAGTSEGVGGHPGGPAWPPRPRPPPPLPRPPPSRCRARPEGARRWSAPPPPPCPSTRRRPGWAPHAL